MAITLTDQQLTVTKGLAEFAERMADQMLHIMENHGLDKIEGFKIQVNVDPHKIFTTNEVIIGNDPMSESGYVNLARGKQFNGYQPLGKNSPEYELLFASEEVRERMQRFLDSAKHPLPPDGLWIGDDRNNPPLDGWEWDLNDSLS